MMFYPADWPVVQRVFELADDAPARRACLEQGLRAIGEPVAIARFIMCDRTDVLSLHIFVRIAGSDPRKVLEWLQVHDDVVRLLCADGAVPRHMLFARRDHELLRLRVDACATAFDVVRKAQECGCVNSTVVRVACVGLPRGEPTDDNMRTLAAALFKCATDDPTSFDGAMFDFFLDLARDANPLQKWKILRAPVTSVLSHASHARDFAAPPGARDAALNGAYLKAAALGLLNHVVFHASELANIGARVLHDVLVSAGRDESDACVTSNAFRNHWRTANVAAAYDPAPSVALNDPSVADLDDAWRVRFMELQAVFAAPMPAE